MDPVLENFGPTQPPEVKITFGNKPPMPRVWFLSEANTELVQIQNDRFIHNWRKADTDAPYPRYENVRAAFLSEARTLAQFLVEEHLGELSINQCEITYVNHIDYGPAEGDPGETNRLFANWRSLRSSAFLPTPEDMQLRWRFRMPDETGRLHVMAHPAWHSNGQRIWTMNLMARGRPLGEGIEGAFRFFDEGRKWIVRGFTDLTSDIMHHHWGKTDAGSS